MNIGINEIEGGIRNSMVRHPGYDVDFLRDESPSLKDRASDIAHGVVNRMTVDRNYDESSSYTVCRGCRADVLWLGEGQP